MTWTDKFGVTHEVRRNRDGDIIKTRDYDAWDIVHGVPRRAVLLPLMLCGIRGNEELRPRCVVSCMTCLVKDTR